MERNDNWPISRSRYTFTKECKALWPQPTAPLALYQCVQTHDASVAHLGEPVDQPRTGHDLQVCKRRSHGLAVIVIAGSDEKR